MDSQRGVTIQDKRARKDGKQNIVKQGDFGARAVWNATDSPASVKGMVGPIGEFAPYKHRETGRAGKKK